MFLSACLWFQCQEKIELLTYVNRSTVFGNNNKKTLPYAHTAHPKKEGTKIDKQQKIRTNKREKKQKKKKKKISARVKVSVSRGHISNDLGQPKKKKKKESSFTHNSK